MRSELEYIAEAKKIIKERGDFSRLKDEDAKIRALELCDKFLPVAIANFIQRYAKYPQTNDYLYVIQCENNYIDIDISKYVDPEIIELLQIYNLANPDLQEWEVGAYGDRKNSITLYFKKK